MGVWSEVSLIHPDDVDWFVTLDKTHHKLSNEGNKGGMSTTRWANGSFPRSGDRVVSLQSHITGVYAYNLRGDMLPPLFIFESKSKEPENYKIDPRICNNLPTVTGKYGGDEVKCYASEVAVRKKGSMDVSLWSTYNRKCVMAPYENRISPTPVRDPVTKKLISGPMIEKTDAGPGRLTKEAESIDFREKSAVLGQHILLSLPNGTESTAELDQMYTKFKPACKRSTKRIAAMKMIARVEARKKEAEKLAADANAATPSFTDDLEQYLEGEEGDPDAIEDFGADVSDDVLEDLGSLSIKVGQSVCSVALTYRDLGYVINGFPGDPIHLRPFDNCFTKTKIHSTFIAVGFLPMTRNAVNDPKVGYELGDGGAPEEDLNRMEILVAEYEQAGKWLAESQFNSGIFDIQPRRVKKKLLPETDEAAVQAIIDSKAINKSGGLFNLGIHVANSAVVMEAMRRVKENEKAAKIAKEQRKKDAAAKTDINALDHFVSWLEAGAKVDPTTGHPKLSKDAAVAIVKVLLPKIAPTEKLKDYKTMASCVKWLGELAGGTTWVDEMKALQASSPQLVEASGAPLEEPLVGTRLF